jgi:mannose-1-phosphate guanylyltransferase / phosphomannomutase
MKAVIIAGGLGTRLRPLTLNTPKPLVPVINRPFTFFQIELLRKHGIKEIIINLHYHASQIIESLKDEERIGVKFYFSLEEEALGTAGAVKNAEEYFDEEPLVVLNGDILTNINISDVVNFHKKNNATVTIAAIPVDDPTKYGLMLTDESGKILQFIEKPNWEGVTTNWINAGIYVIDPKIFKEVPKGENYSFERQVFPQILASGRPMYAFKSEAFWLDIGDPGKYMLAHRAILRGDIEVKKEGSEKKTGIWIDDGTQIDDKAKVHGPAIIGKRCDIRPRARIDEFSVLGNGVVLGENSSVKFAVLWEGVKIGKNTKIANCVIGRDSIIEDNVEIDGMTVLADGSLIHSGSKIGI